MKTMLKKTMYNRESKILELTIQLYSCHNINMKFLVVVTPPSIYQFKVVITVLPILFAIFDPYVMAHLYVQ